MYKCKICGYQSVKGETAFRKITKRRFKKYIPKGKGWEIAEEKYPICRRCL